MSTIAEIRERWAKATRGPWRWFGNTKSKDIYLAATHSGRVSVMQFERYGRSGAQPVFRVRTYDGGIMMPAQNLVVLEAVHRADISEIRHPDATAIASAPEDVRVLLEEIDRLRARTEASERVVAEVRRMEASFLMVHPGLVHAVVALDAISREPST